MIIKENTSIDDQHLDRYVLKPQSIWKIIRLAPIFRMGWFKERDDSEYLQSTESELYIGEPRSVTTNGEVTTQAPAYYRILNDTISVITA